MTTPSLALGPQHSEFSYGWNGTSGLQTFTWAETSAFSYGLLSSAQMQSFTYTSSLIELPAVCQFQYLPSNFMSYIQGNF